MSSTNDILQKLIKWRGVFAGWQLGTRSKDDPECQAVRDHRELTILLRAEVNALTGLLLRKKVFTAQEFDTQLGLEAANLDASYEERFPGFQTTLTGLTVDPVKAMETTKNWRP